MESPVPLAESPSCSVVDYKIIRKLVSSFDNAGHIETATIGVHTFWESGLRADPALSVKDCLPVSDMMIMSELVGKKVVVCMWDGRVGLDREGNFWIPDFIARAGVARIGATRRG